MTNEEIQDQKRLRVLIDQLYVVSCRKNRQHKWRIRSSGWPMTHLVGPTPEAAIDNVIAEIERQRTLSDDSTTVDGAGR